MTNSANGGRLTYRHQRLVVSLMIMVLLAKPAVGQNISDPAQLNKVEAVRVVIVDHVKDKCLPNADALKIEAERILHGSGIKISETNDGHPHQLVIDLVGGEMKRKDENGPIPTGGCGKSFIARRVPKGWLRWAGGSICDNCPNLRHEESTTATSSHDHYRVCHRTRQSNHGSPSEVD